jgi:hypothetical protein
MYEFNFGCYYQRKNPELNYVLLYVIHFLRYVVHNVKFKTHEYLQLHFRIPLNKLIFFEPQGKKKQFMIIR